MSRDRMVQRCFTILIVLSLLLSLGILDRHPALLHAQNEATPTPSADHKKPILAPQDLSQSLEPTPTPTAESIILNQDQQQNVLSTAPNPANPACVHLLGTGSIVRIAIVGAGFNDANPIDVADFQRLAQTIADGFAAVEPYASTLDGFSMYRADDYRGKVVDSRSNAIWDNPILIAAAGVCDYNQIIVIARNSGWAGGAPGYYSVVGSGTPPTCNPNTCTGTECPWTPSCSWDENIAATALHETGHTFAGLRHTCDPATQQLEIQRLEEIERIDLEGGPTATLDEPINCGVQFTGNPNAPCAEWDLPAFWNWVLPGDPTFGCYSVCDGRADWYRAWTSVPNIMCNDYYFENGFTPVDRRLLWNVVSIPDLRPYAPPGYTFPAVPTSRQGTTTPNTLFADTRTFFDWRFLNAGNGAAEGNFYTELWVDNTRYTRYPDTYIDSGQIFGHDDWAETISFPGWYTVKVIADPDNTIAEFDESNNVWERQFYWESISGWKGEYYANPNLDDNPWLTRDDASIDFEWFSDAPDPALPVDGFSARWTRSVEFAAGFYQFTIFHDDGAQFYIDDTLVLDDWCDDCSQTDTVIIELASGAHELKLEVFENAGWAAAQLSWQPVNLPTVQFSSTSYSVNENGGSANINVTLSSASLFAVTVNYATSNGTATAGGDYTATSGVLTFDPGQTSKSFTVAILNDSLDETDKTVNLALSSPSNATLGSPSNAVLTIVDNDPTPTVQFSAATYSVNENGGSATVTANLSAASGRAVTVSYATSNGTATAGSDYTAASGTLTFDPGQTSKTFSPVILNDTLDEADETVNVALSSPSNATLGSPSNAVLTIVDDDSTPTVQFSGATYSVNENGGSATATVNLNSASGRTVTVNYATSNGTATSGSDYTAAFGALTFDPGQTSKTFSVAVLNDTLDEVDETVNLALSSPSNATLGSPSSAVLTIVDDDPIAPTGNAVLALVPTSTTVGLGQTFTIDIWVRTTQPVDSASAYLNFNPALLQVVSITPGSTPDTPIQNQFDNTLGRIDYAAGTFGSPPSSNFTLATVVFRAIAKSTGTQIGFATTLPRGSDVFYGGASILHHLENGNVVVLDAATVRGHVTPPGRPAPPHVRWRIPLTVTLTTSVGGAPLYTFTPTTDDSGYFTVTGITPSAYRVGAKGGNTLRQTAEVTLNAGYNTAEFDPLPPGDSNGDNFVTLVDFSILRTTFAKCPGATGYDSRADFNGDGCVTLVDFSLMRTTFGTGGDERLAAAAPDPQASNAVLTLEPGQLQVSLGDTISLTVRVDAGDQPVDGAAAYLDVDPAVLEIVRVTLGDELPFVLQEGFDAQAGQVHVAAGALGTPATGSFALATIHLRAVGVGATSVGFQDVPARRSDVTFGGVSVFDAATEGAISVIGVVMNEMPSGSPKVYLPIIGR